MALIHHLWFVINFNMRYVWLVFVGLLAAMALVIPRLNKASAPNSRPPAVTGTAVELPAKPVSAFAALRSPPATTFSARADSIVAFGLAQRGTP